MALQTFIAKPLEIEAFQFQDKESGEAILSWIANRFGNKVLSRLVGADDIFPRIEIISFEDNRTIYITDWVVRDDLGKLRVMTDEELQRYYNKKEII